MNALKPVLGVLLFTVGLLTVVLGIIFGAEYFLSFEGLLMVVGGSVANAFLSYRREDVMTAFSAMRNMLKKEPPVREKLHADLMQFMKWSYVVQSKGFIGLEQEYDKTLRDPLLRYGIDLSVTGYAPDRVRDMMRTVADAEFDRRCIPVAVLRNMAACAPSFGMVGTLIGMIILLRNVGADISGIGAGLSIAMLSTLYGLLMARLVCLPAADKLLQHQEADHFRNYMRAEGCALLAEKRSPFYLQDQLNSFLEPGAHFNFDSYRQFTRQDHFSLVA